MAMLVGFMFVFFSALALAQGGLSFETGFTALQTHFTGKIGKVANLIAS